MRGGRILFRWTVPVFLWSQCLRSHEPTSACFVGAMNHRVGDGCEPGGVNHTVVRWLIRARREENRAQRLDVPNADR